MNIRTKVLSTILCVFLVGIGGQRIVKEQILEPRRRQATQLDELRHNIHLEKQVDHRIRSAERDLEMWRQQSLPNDPAVASTLYQNWLIELATGCEMNREVVTPNGVFVDTPAFRRVSFTVEASCSMNSLCEFLFEFQHAKLLHRIKEIQIHAADNNADPNLNIQIQIEAVTLKSAVDKESLFSDDMPKADFITDGRSDFSAIAANNPFARASFEDEAPDEQLLPTSDQSPRETLQELAENVVHVGSIVQGDIREAWLYDRKESRNFSLREGESFTFYGLNGTVKAIYDDSIEVVVRGQSYRLNLAGTLAKLVSKQDSVSTDLD